MTKPTGSIDQATPSSFARRTFAGAIPLATWAIVVAGAAYWWLLPAPKPAVLSLAFAGSVVLAGVIAFFYVVRAIRLRRADAALIETLQNTFDAVVTPQIVVAPDGKIVYANAALRQHCALEGIPPLDDTIGLLGGDADAIRRISDLRAQAAGGTVNRVEIEVTDDLGKQGWRKIEASPLDGKPGYVVLSIDDTSSGHESRRAARETQEGLIELLGEARIGLYSVDAAGRFLFVNDVLADWLDATPEGLVSGGKVLHDVLDPGARGRGAPCDPFGTEGVDRSGEVTFCGLRGRTFRAYVSQHAAPGKSDGKLYTQGVVQELARDAIREDARHQPALVFERVFEDAPMGMALLDTDGLIAQYNKAFLSLAAPGRKDVVGVKLVDLVSGEEQEQVARSLDEAVEGGNVGVAVDVHPKDRSDLAVALYINRIQEEDGRVSGIIVHSLDNTEQRNLEVQFAHSQKMQAVGQLAGGVAHDFNNLLTAMIGFCDLLLLRHKPGDQSFADAMQIKQNASRAANLVRQLLAYSRQQTLKPKILNITDVLAELTHLLRRLVGEAIDLKMIHGRDLGLIRVDQGQLEQVIINLVVNARDASPEGGEVLIQTSNATNKDPRRLGQETLPAGDYVLIEVIDEGVGIDQENISRIFEPFFSTKEVGSGTGLGLSTVYGIVKQTGGYIFANSHPGEGARFSIYLPRHEPEDEDDDAPAPRAEAQEAPRDLTGAGTVLLVEDEDAVRLFSARALRNKGYTVLEARSGEAAMDLLNSGDTAAIDLLITDVVMPRMDGPTLIVEVRKMIPDLRVICISGYAEDSFRKKLGDSTDIHFLPKPFSLNQLAGKVKEVMPTA